MVTYSFWKLIGCLSSLSLLFQSVQKLITATTVTARQPRTTFVCIVRGKWPNCRTTAPTRQSPATKLNVKVSHWIINGNWLSVTKYKSQCNEAYVAIMYNYVFRDVELTVNAFMTITQLAYGQCAQFLDYIHANTETRSCCASLYAIILHNLVYIVIIWRVMKLLSFLFFIYTVIQS